MLIEEAGYHIGYTYKAWSPGVPRDAPYGGDRTRYAPAGTKFGEFSFVATENVPEHGVEGAKQILYDESRQNFDAFLEARPPIRRSAIGGVPRTHIANGSVGLARCSGD